MRVTKTVSQLYGGVSKQIKGMQLDHQFAEVVNMDDDIVGGLRRRPPTKFIAELEHDNINSLDAHWHFIDRDATEKYILVVSNEETAPLAVYSLEGTKFHVEYQDSDALDYCYHATPRTGIRTATAADHTVLVNRSIAPAMAAAAVDSSVPTGYLWLTGIVGGGTEYSFYVTPHRTGVADQTLLASYANSFAYDLYQPAAALANLISGLYLDGNPATKPMVVTPLGTSGKAYAFAITAKLGSTDLEFDARANDSYSTDQLKFVKDAVERLADLPPLANDGEVLKVLNIDNPGSDPYYMRFDAATSLWSETTARGISNSFDAETMPHLIVRMEDGDGSITGTPGAIYFYVKRATWADRAVGDADSIPPPSFVENGKIDDVFFYQNRLGFLSGDSVILSRANEVFDFWPQTVIEVLDDDPIDIIAGGGQVVNLLYAIPAADALLVIGDTQQFALRSGNDVLRATNGTLDLITAHQIQPNCKPIMFGSNLYMISPGSSGSVLLEYFVDSEALRTEAAVASEHVEGYLPLDISYLVPSFNDHVIYIVTHAGEVYTYRVRWRGEEKLQSSFTRFESVYDIIYGAISNGVLYVVGRVYLAGNLDVTLMSMNQDPEHEEFSDCPIRPHLDGMFVSNEVLSETPLILRCPMTKIPSDVTWAQYPLVVVHRETGQIIPGIGISDGTRTVFSNPPYLVEGVDNPEIPTISHTAYIIGFVYDSSIQFSEWTLKSPEGRLIGDSKLSHSHLVLELVDSTAVQLTHVPAGRTYAASGYFDAVYPRAAAKSTYVPELFSETVPLRVRGKANGMVLTAKSIHHNPLAIRSYSHRGTAELRGGSRV